MTTKKLIEAIEATLARSAWIRGVKLYAVELLDEMPEEIEYNGDTFAALLNGARDWKQYSWDGYSLMMSGDIAERLCTPSELRKTHYANRRPNRNEQWLDCQARALFQAEKLIRAILRTEVNS